MSQQSYELLEKNLISRVELLRELLEEKIASNGKSLKKVESEIQDYIKDSNKRIDNIERRLDINDGKSLNASKLFYIFCGIGGIISALTSVLSFALSKLF